jgi:hypothetical protein
MRALIRIGALTLLALSLAVPASRGAGDIDRTAVDFKTPAEIKWVRNAAGTNQQAVLFGDPSKPGLLRRPVRHVVDGYRREVRPGEHGARARGELRHPLRGQGALRRSQGWETVIQVWGMGPATAIPAEKR